MDLIAEDRSKGKKRHWCWRNTHQERPKSKWRPADWILLHIFAYQNLTHQLSNFIPPLSRGTVITSNDMLGNGLICKKLAKWKSKKSMSRRTLASNKATNWQVSAMIKSTDQQGHENHQASSSMDMCSDDYGVVKFYSPMDCWELNFWNCHCIGIA